MKYLCGNIQPYSLFPSENTFFSWHLQHSTPCLCWVILGSPCCLLVSFSYSKAGVPQPPLWALFHFMISSDFHRHPWLQTHAQHCVCSQVCLPSKPLIGIQIFIPNSLISSSISTFLKLNLGSLMKYNLPSMLPASRIVHVCMLLSLEINQDITKMINYKWAIKYVAITMKCKPSERKNYVYWKLFAQWRS